MRRVVWVCLALVLISCDDGPELIVNVLTDFVPGREFTSVRTEVLPVGETSPASTVERVVDFDPGLEAFRAAELGDLAQGTWLVRTTLLDVTGARVASGRVLVELGARTIVTVPITRNCLGVMCGPMEVCVAGQCVDERCSVENLTACGGTCSVDGDCTSSGPACVVGRCGEGICFEVPDDSLCPDVGAVCEPATGCEGGAMPDAGPPDAGPPPPPLMEIRSLTLGDRHTCARTNGGTRCWGANDRGQHGNGSTTPTLLPADPVSSPASGLVSGADHVCGNAFGGVGCWGANGSGQLASSGDDALAPLEVMAGDSIGGPFAVGRAHSCAPQEDLCLSPGPCEHNVWCWGANGEGQLGDGTRMDRSAAVLVDVDWEVLSATAGDAHTCMISREGAFMNVLFCWGANAQGQLGDGSTTRRLTPVTVTLDGTQQVVAGARHTCARANGDVYCWGDNSAGQVGPGLGATVTSPTLIDIMGEVSFLAAGAEHTCVIVDSKVGCWGRNADGQLGDGTTTDRDMLVSAGDIDTASEVHAGLAHTCARLADDTAVCWGRNADGQLGDGTTEARLTPVPVIAP